MLGAAREKRGGPPCERGRDRLLEAGVDLERRERQPLPLRRQRAGSGRDAFLLGERPLERGEPLPGGAGALREVVAFRGGGPRERPRFVRALLELGWARGTAARVRSGNVVVSPELAG